MTTPPPPPLYQLDLETLGYAIGRLLRHTSYRSNRRLRDATVAFLTDAGINFATLTDQDKAILFTHVGRGYATRREQERTHP